MNGTAIPVFLCADVEMDDRPGSRWDDQPWEGFRATWEILEGFRPRLEAAAGSPVRYSWFLRMDPQVRGIYGAPTYAVDAHPDLIDRIAARGDAIGTHPHSYRWDERKGHWFQDQASEGWMDEVLETSFDAYASSLGRPCPLIRFGAHWISARGVMLAERLGARFDMTVEPGLPPAPSSEPQYPYTGSIPGFEGAPQEPYHPAAEDLRRPDPSRGEGIWEIPLSSASARRSPPARPIAPLREPARALRALSRPVRHPLRTLRPPLRPMAMWMRWRSPDAFWDAAERLVSRMDRPYLAFAIRSDFPLNRVVGANVTGIMESLLTRPLARRLRFSTPEEGMRELGYLG